VLQLGGRRIVMGSYNIPRPLAASHEGCPCANSILRGPAVNLRILFLDHVGVLSGAELTLLDIAQHYADFSKILLFSDGPFCEHLKRAGLTVEVLPTPRAVSRISRKGNGMRDLQAIPGVLKMGLRVAQLASDFDVLYANSQKAFVIGALAGKLADKPVIWHLHDMLTADHFSRKRRWLAVTLANRMGVRVIANSRATAAAFVESGGQAERVRMIYNGIDPSAFESVAPTEVEALREELGLSKVPIVGSFSRLAPWKGQHVLLNALAHLPGVHALLAGEALFGEKEDAYAKALRVQAKTLRIADRVHFLGFRKDIPCLMQLSDIVVHTSVAPEPFGRVIVEGMLARRPVVATRAGGATEIIEDGVSGVLIAPRDAKALATVLADLLSDPCRGQALAKAGYAAALERFSLQPMLEGIDEQLRQAVNYGRR
jgi:glycosyltransferase involved in cell wall biosynthesis